MRSFVKSFSRGLLSLFKAEVLLLLIISVLAGVVYIFQMMF
jgi:hypothetical protein